MNWQLPAVLMFGALAGGWALVETAERVAPPGAESVAVVPPGVIVVGSLIGLLSLGTSAIVSVVRPVEEGDRS
jgi:hypothetical protein